MRILPVSAYLLSEVRALLQLALEQGTSWEELQPQLLPHLDLEEVRHAVHLLRTLERPRY